MEASTKVVSKEIQESFETIVEGVCIISNIEGVEQVATVSEELVPEEQTEADEIIADDLLTICWRSADDLLTRECEVSPLSSEEMPEANSMVITILSVGFHACEPALIVTGSEEKQVCVFDWQVFYWMLPSSVWISITRKDIQALLLRVWIRTRSHSYWTRLVPRNHRAVWFSREYASNMATRTTWSQVYQEIDQRLKFWKVEQKKKQHKMWN
jgi:hypothetical protein